MRSLYKRHIPIIPPMIPSFTQSLLRLPPLVYNLFVEDDVTLIDEAKGGHNKEKLVTP